MSALKLAGLALLLSGCATYRIQGVEITPETQLETAVALVAVGTVIHVLDHNPSSSEGSGKTSCLRYLSVPPGKDAPLVCADDL